MSVQSERNGNTHNQLFAKYLKKVNKVKIELTILKNSKKVMYLCGNKSMLLWLTQKNYL